METATQRIAREITIMQSCGGPLSQVEWMSHLAEQLAAVQPLSAEDRRAIAQTHDGSDERAERWVRGIELRCSAFAADPGSPFWDQPPDSGALLAASLTALAILWAAPAAEVATRDIRSAPRPSDRGAHAHSERPHGAYSFGSLLSRTARRRGWR